MKKLLIIAVAALMACTASAQTLTQKRSGKPLSTRQHPKLTQMKFDGPIMAAPKAKSRVWDKALNLDRKHTLSELQVKSIKPVAPFSVRKAPELQESYVATGKQSGRVSKVWTMAPGVFEDKTPCLINVLPLPDEMKTLQSTAVPYTLEGDKIIIQPSCVATLEATKENEEKVKYYVLILSGVDEKGCIYLTIDEDGRLTPSDKDILFYGIFDRPQFELDEDDKILGFLELIEYYSDVKYFLPGEQPAPEAYYEPGSTHLFVETSAYSFVPPYATLPFKNITSDDAETWTWSMQRMEFDEVAQNYVEGEVTTANTRDFSIYTTPGTYLPPTLTASNGDKTSEPFQWGKAMESATGTFDPYVFAGDLSITWADDENGEPLLTCANANDYDMFYSGSLATPEKLDEDFTISSLISYQGKPAAPLYIEGVGFWVYQMTMNDDFYLKCKIQKVTRSEEGRLTLGNVIAEAEITAEDVDPQPNGTVLEWRNFYVVDEYGMSTDVDYLFVEDEFALVFEGWDNNTFQCYPLVDGYEGRDNSLNNSYFLQTGDEDEHAWRWVNDFSHLMTGIYGGYGYLYTEDNTDLTFGADGGAASIHVHPMLYSQAQDGTISPRLFIDSIIIDGEPFEFEYDEDGNPLNEDEFPDWFSFGFSTEDYEGSDYDLIFATAALPEGVTNRTLEIVFMQEGALLKVNITQGEGLTPAILGDVNGDGAVNVADISAIISVMAGTASYNAADVNGDGAVNVADISKVISIMAGTN